MLRQPPHLVLCHFLHTTCCMRQNRVTTRHNTRQHRNASNDAFTRNMRRIASQRVFDASYVVMRHASCVVRRASCVVRRSLHALLRRKHNMYQCHTYERICIEFSNSPRKTLTRDARIAYRVHTTKYEMRRTRKHVAKHDRYATRETFVILT